MKTVYRSHMIYNCNSWNLSQYTPKITTKATAPITQSDTDKWQNILPRSKYCIHLQETLENNSLNDYTVTKNLFKRARIRDDIFQNVSYFNKYDIIGDERPDQVAEKIYGDSSLDWVVLLSNNVHNVYEEQPKTQYAFDKHLLEKYGDYETLYNGVHHYETIEPNQEMDL